MASEYKDYLKPGEQVWITVLEPDGSLIRCGEAGDLIYNGYQVLGTATFLILSQVEGSGKKAKTRTLGYNAVDVKRIGLLAELCS